MVEIFDTQQCMSEHFSEVATAYNDLRKTDLEPLVFIRDMLNGNRGLTAADIGCGAGRYCLEMLQQLGIYHLTCIDNNGSMLRETSHYLQAAGATNFKTVRASAGDIPLSDNSLDCIFSFNAIHHFDLVRFLQNAAKIIRDGGSIFIYTRLRSQNAKNIWGRYFPLFLEKENRLYELGELGEIINSVTPLAIECIKRFKYHRVTSLSRLVELAQGGHYSTFSLYGKSEFETAMRGFQRNIKRSFYDLGRIEWFDENTLLMLVKET